MSKSNRGQTGRWLFVILSLLLVMTLALFVACGGDDDESNGGDSSPTATPEDGGDEETPDATEDGGGDGAAADLSDLASNYEDFTGSVKYETSGFGGDAYSTLTIYKDGNLSRVDFEGADGTGSFITNADGSFICSDGQCIKYPAGQGADPTAAFTAFLSAENIQAQYGDIPEGVDVEETTEEIAGVEATCYSYTGDIDDTEAGDESGEICMSDSGLLLKLEFTAASGDGSFEAVEASDDVSDTDFEPPFPVVELPG
jgi:hypothetical protein